MKFDEPQALSNVAEFHDTFDLPIKSNPAVPDDDRCRLRLNLIEEELNELKQAIQQKDLVEIADAFCDLQYVLSGAILEFGMGSKFRSLFEEVQRSNMSKICRSMNEAQATLDHYHHNKQTAGIIVEKGEHFLVYRTEDGKVLKSINYSEADLEAILDIPATIEE
ncbi:MAG: nucleoside triphosphate pyrophosphohydrolase family protein [Saprospiraceae bacterium]|nr:nucleoside triphosphate pyrophosphohydrolase family protein [Saprospiraceae bacterium]